MFQRINFDKISMQVMVDLFLYIALNSTLMVRTRNSDGPTKPINKTILPNLENKWNMVLNSYLIIHSKSKFRKTTRTIVTIRKKSCEKSLIDFEYSSIESSMISFSAPTSSIYWDYRKIIGWISLLKLNYWTIIE